MLCKKMNVTCHESYGSAHGFLKLYRFCSLRCIVFLCFIGVGCARAARCDHGKTSQASIRRTQTSTSLLLI